jgi:hypothetical protein
VENKKTHYKAVRQMLELEIAKHSRVFNWITENSVRTLWRGWTLAKCKIIQTA